MSWREEIEAGDMLIPDKLWNDTGRSKLSSPTKALSVNKSGRPHSQTGVMILVQFTNGRTAWLDAGWFTGVADSQGVLG